MFKEPRIIQKRWGCEEWLHNSPMYCCKLLHLDQPRVWCSAHYHEQKHETFRVLSGRVLLELDGVQHVMEPGSVVDIQPYTEHRFTAEGTQPAVLLEASTQHFEADSKRKGVDYGWLSRKSTQKISDS